MMKLTICEGEGAGTSLELQTGENLIGRSRSARMQLTGSDISGKHLLIVVAEDKAIAENLGRSGTLLDEKPLEETVILADGQKLRLGASTVLIFEDDSQRQADEPGEKQDQATVPPPATAKPAPEATRVAAARIEPAAAGEATVARTMAAQIRDSDEAGQTIAAVRRDDSPEGGTRIMQTRVASQEEIEYLRETERLRGRKKATVLVVVGILFVLAALLLWPRQPPPETTIEWPRDQQDRLIVAVLPSPSHGSAENGGFNLGFPGNPGWTNRTEADGTTVIETMVGRDRDIPLRLLLNEKDDPREATFGRLRSLENWMAEIREAGGSWSFDPPSSGLFLGPANGIPAIYVAYHRDDGKPWFGTAILFRHGASRIVLRAEVPANERVRAQGLVYPPFFDEFAADFVASHWEGTGDAVAGDPASLLRQARAELEYISPAAWSQTQSKIVNALRLAVVNANREQQAEGLRLLRRLRSIQGTWFNAQTIAYFNALTQGEEGQAERIAEICKAVFANDNDRRYYRIRQNQW